MVAFKPKQVVTLRVSGDGVTHGRTDVTVRDLRLVIDEPRERGGTNQGPSPTETLLAALAACTNRITHKVADAHGVRIAKVTVEVQGRFDRRGVQLAEEIDRPFVEITQDITVVTDADDAALERVKTDLPRFCPISKVIRRAGTPVTDRWTVRRP